MAIMLPPDPLFVLKENMSGIMCLLTSTTDKILYAGTQAGMVHVWDLQTYRQIDKFENSKESCISLQFSTNNKTLIIQDKSSCVRFWQNDQEHGWIIQNELRFNYYGFCKIQIHNNFLFAPGNQSKIQIYSLTQNNLIDEIRCETETPIGDVMDFKIFTKNNEVYMLAAFDGFVVILYNISQKINIDLIKLSESALTIDFDSVTMKGLVGTAGNNLTSFILSNDKLVSGKEVLLVNEGTASISIRGDHKLVAVGGWDGRLRLYSWRYLNLLAVLLPHSATVQALAFTHEKPYLLCAGCKDGKISIWDLYNQQN